ncbi:MAG: hypothetical protein AAFV01_07165 [Bacteroidota bacterium]
MPQTTELEAVFFGALQDTEFSKAMGHHRLTPSQASLLAICLAAMIAEFPAEDMDRLRADYRAAHPNQDWPDD